LSSLRTDLLCFIFAEIIPSTLFKSSSKRSLDFAGVDTDVVDTGVVDTGVVDAGAGVGVGVDVFISDTTGFETGVVLVFGDFFDLLFFSFHL